MQAQSKSMIIYFKHWQIDSKINTDIKQIQNSQNNQEPSWRNDTI